MKTLFLAILVFSFSSLARASSSDSHLFTTSIDMSQLGLNLGVYRMEIRANLLDTGSGTAKKHVEFNDPAEGISSYLCVSDAILAGGSADIQLIDTKTNSVVYHDVENITFPIEASYEVDSMASACQFSWGAKFQTSASVTFGFKPLVIAGQHITITWTVAPTVDLNAGFQGTTVQATSATLDDPFSPQIFLSSASAGGSTFDLNEQ